MSNHHHTGIHDPDGNFPLFIEYFHGLLARCQNAYLGRFENFWSSEATSVVRLVEPNDVLGKMAYAYANPAAADLVDAVQDWPGATTFEASLTDGTLTAKRPKHFFRDDGDMPETVALDIHRPRGFEILSESEWASLVRDQVKTKESTARQTRAIKGIKVLGRARVLAQNPFHRPKTSAAHFKTSPKLAAKNKWARIEAILRNRGFYEKYRYAIRRHLAGIANVLFPFGTFWMRKFGKVSCEAADGTETDKASALVPVPT